MPEDTDKRPEVAQDKDKSIPTDPKEKWHQPEATLNEGPAGSPNPTKQSQTD